LPAALLRF